jgi:hypothetical protein
VAGAKIRRALLVPSGGNAVWPAELTDLDVVAAVAMVGLPGLGFASSKPASRSVRHLMGNGAVWTRCPARSLEERHMF